MPVSTGPDTELRRELERVDAQTLRWALDLARLLRDPILPGLLFTGVLLAAPIVVLVVSAHAMTRWTYASLQLPYVVSGGLGSLAIVTVGALLGSVLGQRRDHALENEEFGALTDELTGLARAFLASRGAGATNAAGSQS